MRKIPKKNYIILLGVITLTLLLAIYLRNYYIKQETINTGLEIENVYQIDEKSFSNYVVENNDFILYVADRQGEDLESIERELGNYLTEKEYNKDIIYLNLEKVSKSFYKDVKDKYFNDHLKKYSFVEQTNLLYFEDKKVSDILYTKYTKTNIDDMKKFVDKHTNMEASE